MKTIFIVALLLASVFCNDKLDKLFWEVLGTPQVLSRDQSPPSAPFTFEWKNCGPANSPIALTSLSIMPDPIVLGTNITVKAQGGTKVIINPDTAVSIDLSISKKVFGYWVPIPCVDGVGSCTYQSPCALMEKDVHLCPALTPWGLPCKCPIAAANYGTPAAGIPAKTNNPGYSWLATGDFQISATINGKGSTKLGCIEVTFSLDEK